MGMGKTYTEEFKKAAIARLANESTAAVADDLKVAKSLLRNWKTKSELGLPLSKAGKRENYTPEFKAKVVARAQKESPLAASKAFKLPAEMIRRWVAAMPGPASKSFSNKKTYPPELKRAAVARIEREGLSVVAKDVGIPSGMLANWRTGLAGKRSHKAQRQVITKAKKNYYIPVSARAAMLTEKRQAGAEDIGGRKLLRTVHACVGMLRQVRGQANNSDPVHLTAMLVLATLEGKM